MAGIKDLIPQSPFVGPPLPKFLNVLWPWYVAPVPPIVLPPEITLVSAYNNVTVSLEKSDGTTIPDFSLKNGMVFQDMLFTAGDWTATFSAPGYYSTTVSFAIADGKPKTIDSGMMKAIPPTPKITFTSAYDNVTVALANSDGLEIWSAIPVNAALQNQNFTAGTWTAIFSAPGYYPATVVFTISDGEQKTIDSGVLQPGTAYITYHNPYKYAMISFWDNGWWDIWPGGADWYSSRPSGKNTIEIYVVYPFVNPKDGTGNYSPTYHGSVTGILLVDGHYDSTTLFPDMPKELTINNFNATWDWEPKSSTWKEFVCDASLVNDTDSPITGRVLNLMAQRAGHTDAIPLPPITLQPGESLPLHYTPNYSVTNGASYSIWLEDQVTGNRSPAVTVNT